MSNSTSTITTTFLGLAARDRWPIVVTVVGSLAVAWIVQFFLGNDPLSTIPKVKSGGRWLPFADPAAYVNGYKKFKAGYFRLSTQYQSQVVVISPKFLNELKKLPDDVLSFSQAIDESMYTKYTGVDADTPILPHTIKTSLTPSLLRLNPTISDEVLEAMALELPQGSDWTEVNINSKLLRIVAMVSGRVFVGPELCRDEAYLDASINYTTDLMIAVHVVALVPKFLRSLISPHLPPVKKLQQRIREADEFLRPIVAKRIEAAKQPGYEKPDDMLQWIIESQKKFGDKGDKELAKMQLGISFAAIHTTTLTTTNAFYTLAAKRDLIPVLQEDIEQALAESDGVFTNLAMQNMKKLDSFMKETLRFYPLGAASFHRKVLKSFTFSNGQTIPAGVNVQVPAAGVNFDDEIFDEPDTFDALRYYKLRMTKTAKESSVRAAEAVANSQFVSVGTSSLTFGYGRHACPGRFFAANEIKMIIATALLHYDMKLIDGETERYPNLTFGAQSIPDPKRTIMMRKRNYEADAVYLKHLGFDSLIQSGVE